MSRGFLPPLLLLSGCCACGEGDTSGEPKGTCSAATLAWVQVPSGSFVMGSPDTEVGRDGDESPHTVWLTHAFEAGATEVTQGVFQACMGYNPAYFSSAGMDHPVENVAWHEAAAFANALSAAEALPACYACEGEGVDLRCGLSPSLHDPYLCGGYRLPTEAEWEYAARAGETAAFFNSGNLVDIETATCDAHLELDNGAILADIAWFCGSADNTTHAVGTLQPNAWGLHDTAGNVWEWVGDAYVTGPLPVAADPFFDEGTERCDRGGSWFDGKPALLRSAARGGGIPAGRSTGMGFRVVRTVL